MTRLWLTALAAFLVAGTAVAMRSGPVEMPPRPTPMPTSTTMRDSPRFHNTANVPASMCVGPPPDYHMCSPVDWDGYRPIRRAVHAPDIPEPNATIKFTAAVPYPAIQRSAKSAKGVFVSADDGGDEDRCYLRDNAGEYLTTPDGDRLTCDEVR